MAEALGLFFCLFHVVSFQLFIFLYNSVIHVTFYIPRTWFAAVVVVVEHQMVIETGCNLHLFIAEAVLG